MLPTILIVVSLIAAIPLLARSAAADGFIRDLGSLDSFSHARAVNELGQIVGESTNDDFRNPRATLWENGTMTDLGNLGGGEARACMRAESTTRGKSWAGATIDPVA